MPTTVTPGGQALHTAAKNRNIDRVRQLLEREHVDPNTLDKKGCSPLCTVCAITCPCVDLVRLLLEAGADAALTDNKGLLPLHQVAYYGHIDVVDMLYSKAPTTLNHCTRNGETPLWIACARGHESMVSKLLSLGAMEAVPRDGRRSCPLVVSVAKGFVGVVRVLISEAGIKAVGGEVALRNALHAAIECRQVTILRMLLSARGEEKRFEWVHTIHEGRHLVHVAAAACYSAAMSILLHAGANEAAQNVEGDTPRTVIGNCHPGANPHPMRPGEKLAICRMLDRGQAYRARSWAWPLKEEAEAGGNNNDDCDATATAAVPLSPPGATSLRDMGLPIFRTKVSVPIIGW